MIALGALSIGLALASMKPATNPILWADVPDISIIRVGKTYYMSSTTMHMSPGLPIMKSRDLVHWTLASYAYRTLGDNDALTLQNGRSAYGKGSWASSLRYHQGKFIVSTFSSTTGKTHIYTTSKPSTTPWEEVSFWPSFHDHSLIFEDDGRVFLAYGAGDIRLVELKADLSGPKPGGINQVIIPNASKVAGDKIMLPAEGTQVFKIRGKYYVINIVWPQNGMRTALVHRADKLTGPYEGRILLQDKGVAQGGLIDTPDGKWYAYLFQDHGAVGRVPFLVPIVWEDGWPVVAKTDSNGVKTEVGKAPTTLDIDAKTDPIRGIVASDEFNRPAQDRSLPLAWQWNHNPDDQNWSFTESGKLRLTTGRVDKSVLEARNTLTQRTFGPSCQGITSLDTSNMKDGDQAGLLALMNRYAFVGVRVAGDTKSIVMVSASPPGPSPSKSVPSEIEAVPLTQNRVFLRMECDFANQADLVRFAWSLDGRRWNPIGKPHRLRYDLVHFMGCRFGLFNFATKAPGGSADFDFFRISAPK